MISLLVRKAEDEHPTTKMTTTTTTTTTATSTITPPSTEEDSNVLPVSHQEQITEVVVVEGEEDVKKSVGLLGSSSTTKNKKQHQSYSKTSNAKVSNNKRSTWIQYIIWKIISLLIDSIIIIPLLLYCCTCWIDYVHDHYLQFQIVSLQFTDERSETDITYYRRHCGDDINFEPQFLYNEDEYIAHESVDITTFNSNDLWVSPNASNNDVVEHQLKHGFTVIENVLSYNTMNELRHHVNYKNYHTNHHLYVIEQTNRFSILLSTAESPIVAKALEEIANHEQLTNLLENLMGSNPALIELTAISSSYGAIDQFWHEDTSYENSAMNNAKAFSPLYSLFIQLQNTTISMGATYGCPGTHYCTNGPMADLCTNYGIPIVKDHIEPTIIPLYNGTNYTLSNQYWPGGDALLMNMDNHHRGSAYTELGGNDRIMLILTFTPKQKKRSPTRQMSNGITFQCQYDMWGHTLYDMQTACSTMQYPWVILKSLGLYNYYNINDYGYDYITSSSQRMINYDNGFTSDEYEDFINNKGGIPWIPLSLQKKNAEEITDFYPFLLNTLINCLEFLQQLSIGISIIYILLLSPFLYIIPYPTSSLSASQHRFNHALKTDYRRRGFISSILRFMCISTLIYTLYYYMKRHVDETNWAIDINASRRFTSVVTYEEFYYLMDHKVEMTNDHLTFYYNNRNEYYNYDNMNHTAITPKILYEPMDYPTTYPTRYDVLIETRYGVKEWGSFRRFIEYHPGNIVLQEIITNCQFQFQQYSSSSSLTSNTFPIAMVQWIISTILNVHHGRFLYQLPDGAWGRMNDMETISYVLNEIQKKSSSNSELQNEMRYIMNEQKYGTYRSNIMIKYHSIPFLKILERQLFPPIYSKKLLTQMMTKNKENHSRKYQVQSHLSNNKQLQLNAPSKYQKRNPVLSLPSVILSKVDDPQEPFIGAWLESGNIAEIFSSDAWYVIQITHVSALGRYSVINTAGSAGEIDIYNIRPVEPFESGESIAVLTKRTTDDPNESSSTSTSTTTINEEDDEDEATTTVNSYYVPCKMLGYVNNTYYAQKDSGGIISGFSLYELARPGENDREPPERFDYTGGSNK